VNGRVRSRRPESGIRSWEDPVGHDNIMRLDGLLRSLAQRYRARKVAREQDLNGKLTRLEETKSFLADLWDIEALLCGFAEETPQIISRLSSGSPERDWFPQT